MSSFRPIDEKPSFAVKFNEFDKQQHYQGLTRVLLNNSVQDGTYLHEFISSEICAAAKVPAARATAAPQSVTAARTPDRSSRPPACRGRTRRR
jgi:hypothetical protein